MADAIEVVHEDGRRARMTPARLAAVSGDGWATLAHAGPAPKARRARGARTTADTAEQHTDSEGVPPENSEEE